MAAGKEGDHFRRNPFSSVLCKVPPLLTDCLTAPQLATKRPVMNVRSIVERLLACFHTRRASLQETGEVARRESTSELFPIFPPPPPRILLERQDHFRSLAKKRKYAAPKGIFEDGPLFSIFRLYEHIILDNNVGMRNELETFWWKPWPVHDIPDPKDYEEPERYAVLACIPSLIVESFNERIRLGLRREGRSLMTDEEREKLAAATPEAQESLPSWVLDVPSLSTLLKISHQIEGEEQLETLNDKRASPAFKAKNILVWEPHIHFI
jgi:hypothetical protein